MDHKTIADYFQNQVNWKEKSLIPMDKRYKIPKRIKAEIKELKAMIKHLKVANFNRP